MWRLRVTVGPLRDEIVVDNLVDRMRVGERDQLVVLGDILPIVDKDSLDMVRDRDPDRRACVEAIFLLRGLELMTQMR